MDLILYYYDQCNYAIDKGANLHDLFVMPSREDIGRYKYLEENKAETGYIKLIQDIDSNVTNLIKEAGEADD